MMPLARDASSAFADRQFGSDWIFHTFYTFCQTPGIYSYHEHVRKAPQYLHSRPSLDCLSVLGPSGCFCTGILLETSFFTELTGSCALSFCIFFSCTLVASRLIRNDLMDFFRLQSCFLNNLVLAALSLQPSTSRSCTISSSRVPNLHGSLSWRNLITNWLFVFCACYSVL